MQIRIQSIKENIVAQFFRSPFAVHRAKTAFDGACRGPKHFINSGLFLSLLYIGLCSFLPGDPPEFTKEDLLGKIDPARHPDFEEISDRYCSRDEMYLREEVYDAFKDMWKAAKRDGVNLTIVSATRNYAYQLGIWNRKWATFGGNAQEKTRQIMEYSSMPGISRHHWGTDFDLNALNNEYFEHGEGLIAYQWLEKNAGRFGFFQPYTAFNDFRDTGYHEEKWHWSYRPLAERFSRAYREVIDYDDISGFPGANFAREFQVINNYVLGIES